MTMTNNSLGSAVAAAAAAGSVGAVGGSVTVTPTGNVHPAAGPTGPPLQIPMSVAASLMASVSSKSNLPQQPQPPQPPAEILQPSVTVSLASTPYVGKEEVISAGNQIVPQPQQPQQPPQPSVIVTPTVVPVVNNGNGMKIETMNKVEVTPILEDLGVSGPKKAKLQD